jgi:hypothetical protein
MKDDKTTAINGRGFKLADVTAVEPPQDGERLANASPFSLPALSVKARLAALEARMATLGGQLCESEIRLGGSACGESGPSVPVNQALRLSDWLAHFEALAAHYEQRLTKVNANL